MLPQRVGEPTGLVLGLELVLELFAAAVRVDRGHGLVPRSPSSLTSMSMVIDDAR
jgi:hypothetical protein